MSRLIVVGAGGHGAVVAEAARDSGRWRDISFLDDDESIEGVVDFPVAGRTEKIDALESTDTELVVAIGDNRQRVAFCDEILKKGLRLATVIHPRATISKSATIAAGTVVFAGAVVNARANVGRACILNTGATIDHDCKLEDGVHVSPGANLAGNVHVGQCAWVGIGSSVREGVAIGRDSIVGAGAAVVCDVGDALTIVGVPAKVLAE